MRIAVLGAGAWGTALSLSLAARHEVRLWSHRAAQALEIASTRRNPYLPDFPLPASITVTSGLASAVDQADLILTVVPSAGLRDVLKRLSSESRPIVWGCKGMEAKTAMLPHEVAAQELPESVARGALSGPSFAQEVAQNLPAALTLAAGDARFCRELAAALHSPRLRIYSSDDVIGVEIAGAAKNVMAIAAGLCDGMGLGNNARAALIARGLAEITRLGLKLGGKLETFMGLAGAGDLILTCTGDLSRNRRVGLELAAGKTLAAILNQLGHVAEGVSTSREVLRLAEKVGVDMPITRAVCRVLHDSLAPGDALEELLKRDPKIENYS